MHFLAVSRAGGRKNKMGVGTSSQDSTRLQSKNQHYIEREMKIKS